MLLPSDQQEEWQQERKLERRSAGANATMAMQAGGDFGRLLVGLAGLEDIESSKFPDPEPYRVLRIAIKEQREILMVEPEDEDPEWASWVDDSIDAMTTIWKLTSTVWARWRFNRYAMAAVQDVTPPPIEKARIAADLAAAAAISAAWWRCSERLLTPELLVRRDDRLAGRLRGVLSRMRESRQFDGEGGDGCVLLVTLLQAWLPAIRSALELLPEPEDPTSDAEEE
jgi:hypothetical protein